MADLRWLSLTKFEWQRLQSALEQEHNKRVQSREHYGATVQRDRKECLRLYPTIVAHRTSGAYVTISLGDMSWLNLSDMEYTFWFCMNAEMEYHLRAVEERLERKREAGRRRYASLHVKVSGPTCFGIG